MKGIFNEGDILVDERDWSGYHGRPFGNYVQDIYL